MNAAPIHPGGSDRVSFRELAIHAGLLFVVIAILFPTVFLRGEHITPAGLLYEKEPWAQYMPAGYEIPRNELPFEAMTTFYYWYALSKEALEAGEWPLWNPQQFCGTPLMANFQTALFYPPRLLHAFLEINLATTLYMMLRVWLCGATAYIAARGMGMSIAASRFASLGWMLCTLNMVWLYWPVPDVSAWAPILLLGVERAVQGRYRQSFFTVAMAGTLILLAGHPETALVFGMGVGAYFFLRLLLQRRTGRALYVPILVVGAAWVPALLICAVQLLPFTEFVLNSYTFASRSGNEEIVQKLLQRATIAIWVPRFFGSNPDDNFWGLYEDGSIRVMDEVIINTNHVSYLYVGIVAWVAFIAAMSRLRSDTILRHRAIAILVPGLIGLILATESPLLAFVHKWPLFSAMVRTYYVFFLLMGLVFLAAFGVDALYKGAFKNAPRRAIVFGTLVLAIGIGVVYVTEQSAMIEAGVRAFVTREVVVAALFGGLALAVFTIGKLRTNGRWACLLLTALLACDLLYAARGLRPTARSEDILPRTALTDRMVELDGDGRVEMLAARIPPGVSQLYGLDNPRGYDAITPMRTKEFLEDTEAFLGSVEELVGATLHVFRGEPFDPLPSRFEVAAQADGFTIYRNLRALPRAFLVGQVETLADQAALFARMAQPGFEPSKLLVTTEPIGPFAEPSNEPLGDAKVVNRRMGKVDVEVGARRQCALVLSDTYYPGWNVYVDDKKAEMFPAYHAFRGVEMSPGTHRVSFRYEPASFRIGYWVSALTCLIAIVVSCGILARKRFA